MRLRLLTLTLALTLFGCEAAEPESWETIEMLNAWEDDSKYFDTPDKGELFRLVPPAHSGITFTNDLRETMRINYWAFMYNMLGSGIAVGDINNDGLPDLYFAGSFTTNKLYLNKGDLQFEDISVKAGITDSSGLSTGCVMVDIDQDGLLDIYQCKNGPFGPETCANKLWLNNGDLTFREAAGEFGIADSSYTTHALFFDYDKDQDLDLFLLTHPADYMERDKIYNSTKVEKGINLPDKFYRNEGNGKFVEVGKQIGINDHGYGLGVAAGDLDGDGWTDLYIANDFVWNDIVYLNNGDGTFREATGEALKKMSRHAMGMDIGDANNDGFPEIAVSDIDMESNVGRKTDRGNAQGWATEEFEDKVHGGYHHQYTRNMFQTNNGDGTFSETANFTGTTTSNWSWACLFVDADLDGFQDLFIGNGFYLDSHEDRKVLDKTLLQATRKNDRVTFYKTRMQMPRLHAKWRNHIYRNLRRRDVPAFAPANDEWGIQLPTYTCGAVYADLDNDGDPDFVFSNTNQAMTLYENRAEKLSGRYFLKVRFEGPEGNRNGIGAEVRLFHADGSVQLRHYNPARGYLSSTARELLFGWEAGAAPERLEVRWPDGKMQEVAAVPVDATFTLQYAKAEQPRGGIALPEAPLFAENPAAGIDFVHRENEFDDFADQYLIPHRMSRLGPASCVGDINGDGYDDVYIGGASGQAGQLYMGDGRGGWQIVAEEIFEMHAHYEDQAAIFIDADRDGDLDLYVGSGGTEVEVGTTQLQDRLYIYDGGFAWAQGALPDVRTATGCIAAFDYDKDGDEDLFVGGRVGAQFPLSSTSYLLRNDDGQFVDVTDEFGPELRQIGMVTTAVWADVHGDWRPELLVGGEWMGLQCWGYKDGKMVDISGLVGLKDMEGWWSCITAADIDGDGDMDLVCGNQGLNTYYKAAPKTPLRLHVRDFNGDGREDVVMSHYWKGREYPSSTMRYLDEKMPGFADEVGSYEAFGQSDMQQLFGHKGLDSAMVLKMTECASMILWNEGQAGFRKAALPPRAQLSPITGAICRDFDGDGHKDILCHGNFHPTAPLFERRDAGIGLLLKGDGAGHFEALLPRRTGFHSREDARGLHLMQNGKRHAPAVLVVNNNGPVKVFEWRR